MDIQGALICGIIGLLIGAGFSRVENTEKIIKTIETRCSKNEARNLIEGK